MKKLIPFLVILIFLFACGNGEESVPADTTQAKPTGAIVTYDVPEAIAVPEAKTPQSDTDWEAIVHNKEIEVIELINILNPVAAYLTAGFKQYGDKIKNQTAHEEWTDTQAQLTEALTLYGSCKEQKKAGKFNKQLFLDMENAWQILVKTGVAGLRAKAMLDTELQKL